MDVQVVVSVISLIGVIITGITTVFTVSGKLTTSQAVTNEKLQTLNNTVENLVKEVKSIPVMDYRMKQMESEIKDVQNELKLLKGGKA